jgi:putative peptide zinc metalloprotease protein
VESANVSEVVINSDGFITQVYVQAGDAVKQGQLLVVARNPQLLAQKAQLQAQLDHLLIEERAALSSNPNELRSVQAKLAPIQQELTELSQRLADLQIHASRDGVIVGQIEPNMVGTYLKRGQVIGRIEDLSDLRVTALVDQTTSDFAFFDQIASVELRSAGQVRQVLASEVTYRSRKGRQTLPHPALGYSGGGTIALDPKDKNGMTSLRPMFEMWLKLPHVSEEHQAVSPLPGQRVYVRFTLKNKRPLIFQWGHRARQILRDRLPDLPVF